MNKPKLSVTITALNLVGEETEFRTHTYTKANGLKNITIDGVSNDLPYYGIISRGGNVNIIDIDGWLKVQSDDNVFPDVSIDICMDDTLLYSFISDSEITYMRQTNMVTINLVDKIESLQNKNIEYNMIYTNNNAYNVFIDICSIIGITCVINENTKEYTQNIRIRKMFIEKGKAWDIIQEYAYGLRCIFYRQGSNYYLKRVEE